MSLASLIPDTFPADKLVKSAVVAGWLGVSAKTLYAWSAQKLLPAPVHLGPRTTMYRVGELRKALQRMEKGDKGKKPA